MSINDTEIDFFDGVLDTEQQDVPVSQAQPEVKVKRKPGRPKKLAKEEQSLLKQILSSKDDNDEDEKPSKKTTTKSKTAKTPEEQEEEEQECLNIRMKIQRYADNERFGTYLTKQMGFKLDTKSMLKLKQAELEALLKRVQFAIGNRSTTSMVDGLIQQGLLVGEGLAVNVAKLRVQGLTSNLLMNEQFLDDLEAVKLEYLSFGHISPLTRMSLTIAQTGFNLHAGRLMMEKQAMLRQSAPIPNATNEAKQAESPNAPTNTPVSSPTGSKSKSKAKGKKPVKEVKPTTERKDNLQDVKADVEQFLKDEDAPSF